MSKPGENDGNSRGLFSMQMYRLRQKRVHILLPFFVHVSGNLWHLNGRRWLAERDEKFAHVLADTGAPGNDLQRRETGILSKYSPFFPLCRPPPPAPLAYTIPHSPDLVYCVHQDYRGLRSDALDPTVPTTVSLSDSAFAKGTHHPVGLGQGPGQGDRYADGYPFSNGHLGGVSMAGVRTGTGGRGPEQHSSTERSPPPGTVTLIKPRIKRYRLKVMRYRRACACVVSRVVRIFMSAGWGEGNGGFCSHRKNT